MTAQTDRRVRKTKKALRSGLIQLMTEKSIHDITVKELTELVDINRATFYNHYQDIYNLLEAIEQDMYEEFMQTLNRHTVNEQADKGKTVLPPNQSQLPLFLEIFQFLVDNSNMCSLMLSEKGDSEFIKKILNSGKDKYIKEWTHFYHIEKKEMLDATYAFVASGIMGLIRYWLANGMKQSPAEMAAIAEKAIVFSMKMFEQEQ